MVVAIEDVYVGFVGERTYGVHEQRRWWCVVLRRVEWWCHPFSLLLVSICWLVVRKDYRVCYPARLLFTADTEYDKWPGGGQSGKCQRRRKFDPGSLSLSSDSVSL